MRGLEVLWVVLVLVVSVVLALVVWAVVLGAVRAGRPMAGRAGEGIGAWGGWDRGVGGEDMGMPRIAAVHRGPADGAVSFDDVEVKKG